MRVCEHFFALSYLRCSKCENTFAEYRENELFLIGTVLAVTE